MRYVASFRCFHVIKYVAVHIVSNNEDSNFILNSHPVATCKIMISNTAIKGDAAGVEYQGRDHKY